PNSGEFDDIVFVPTNNIHSCTAFWRKSRNPHIVAGTGNGMVELQSVKQLRKEINSHYIGHHPFYWQRPHVAWLEAKCPVYIDFGTDILWHIENYKNQFQCVRAVAKEKVIFDIINESNIQSIANNHSIM